MRRPRPCLARVDPGGLASPSAPTMKLCLQWLDGAGEGWAKACLDGELRFAPVPEVRPQGRRNRCDGASERRILLLPRRVVSALHLPSKRGDQLKAQLARRRGNAELRATKGLPLAGKQ